MLEALQSQDATLNRPGSWAIGRGPQERYGLQGGASRHGREDDAMKPDIHPEYHTIKVVMTDGDGIPDAFDLGQAGRR